MKHTPGPWRICHGGTQRSRTTIRIITPKGNLSRNAVASINLTIGDLTGSSHANALLIAAAPDLLAACKAVLAKQSDASIFRLPDNCDAMKKIRTAIAKAEGGAAC